MKLSFIVENIGSGQVLMIMFIEKFSEKFAIYMRKKNLTPNDLLSIKQVLQLEDALQTGLIDDLTAHDLFK